MQQQSPQRRFSTQSEGQLESNVLRKVASLTLDRATIDKPTSKPKFTPPKLDFQLYEKFEGNIKQATVSGCYITWLVWNIWEHMELNYLFYSLNHTGTRYCLWSFTISSRDFIINSIHISGFQHTLLWIILSSILRRPQRTSLKELFLNTHLSILLLTPYFYSSFKLF